MPVLWSQGQRHVCPMPRACEAVGVLAIVPLVESFHVERRLLGVPKMIQAAILTLCLFSQDPKAYHDAYRMKATSRTLAGRIVWAQLKRDEIAERRAENRSKIAASFTPLSDEDRAAKRLRLAQMYDQQGWYAAHEACLRGIKCEWPNTPAAAEATLLLGGQQ